MSKPHPSYSVSECKIQASLLLKALNSNELSRVQLAIRRLKRHPEFTDLTDDQLKNANIKRKHVLYVIALEKGFASWAELKHQLPFIRGGFLNQWFSSYDQAKAWRDIHGGYLFPYQKQFFVCSAEYVANLGLDPDHPDWKLIGYDWAKPNNEMAWKRLSCLWQSLQENKYE